MFFVCFIVALLYLKHSQITDNIYKNVFRQSHQPTSQSTRRSIFLSLSWGTRISWKLGRSENFLFLINRLICLVWIWWPFLTLCMRPQVFGNEMQVKLYAPPSTKIDPSIAVILLISIGTVVLGGYWSGACERWDFSVLYSCELKTRVCNDVSLKINQT